jgi:hypothetical protein
MAMFRNVPIKPLDRGGMHAALGMLVTDAPLRARFVRDPEEALWSVGVQLTRWEVRQLQALLVEGDVPGVTLEEAPPADAGE